MNELMNGIAVDTEKTYEQTGVLVGRLGDLGLGMSKGIPSEYAEKTDIELREIAEQLSKKLTEPTDLTALSCIDGRGRLKNMDGSNPEVRYHRAGATSANLMMALNADASVVSTLSPEASLMENVRAIDTFVEETTGYQPSAHEGGCGKANGEEADQEAIHRQPEILGATKAVLERADVRSYLLDIPESELEDTDQIWGDALGEKVRENAGKTAQLLHEAGWDGQAYVNMVETENPQGVEDLVVDHEDEFHGHKEPYYAIILGDKTLNDKGFVMNMKVIKDIARAYAGQRGFEGYKQAVIAGVAEEVSVGGRLPSDKTPVFVLRG